MNISSVINNAAYNSGVSSTGKKASSKGKKSIEEVLDVKTIEKMRQFAAKDAVKGERGHAATIFKHHIREKVAPDRKKIFAEAEANAPREVRKTKGERPHELWEYLLGIVDKLDEDLAEFQGSDESVYLEAFDEKGNLCGRYSSNSGWHIVHTPDEEKIMNILGKIYNDTFMEVYRATHGNGDDTAAYAGSDSQLDVRA